MRLAQVILCLLLVVGLAACSTWDKLNKTEKGAVIGTGAGAAVGAAAGDTTGALIGGATGGVAGGVIGHELEEDEYDADYD